MIIPPHLILKPVPLSMIIICGIVLFFLDLAMQIVSAVELAIMQTPILKQIYYFLMI